MLTIPRKTLARNILFFLNVIKGQQNFLQDEGMTHGEFLGWIRSFKHCFDILNALTDKEYQMLRERIMNRKTEALKLKMIGTASFLFFFHLMLFSQPVFSSFSDTDFIPPATTFDTTITERALPSLVRFKQVSKIWESMTDIYFLVYYQPKPCGELQQFSKGLCRPYSLSLPIRNHGIYYVDMKGKDGTDAKARIEIQPSGLTAKFWKL